MLQKRIIPVLLLKNDGLVKTIKFKKPRYIGDPINAVKIYNDREVDELIFLDIEATKNKKEPNFRLIKEIATECFMPFCYGGGINNFHTIKKIFNLGAEKISINSEFYYNPNLVKKASESFGSQSIVVSIDVKKNLFGKYETYINGGKINTHQNPIEIAKQAEKFGAGEIILNSIDKDGTMSGYDLKLIKTVSDTISIPLIACGGAKNLDSLRDAINTGASAAAAGSLFIYHGSQNGILINYPEKKNINKIIK